MSKKVTKKAATKTAKKVSTKKVEPESKEVTVASNNDVALNNSFALPDELAGLVDTSVMGAKVDKDDIIISKAWLLQSMSDCVTDDNHEAIAGEYRDSRTLKLIAEKGGSFDAFVISNFKTWQCFEEDESGDMVYSETLDYYDYPTLKFDSVNPDTGRKIHRDLVLGFYAVLAKDLLSGNPFPLIIDFKRTSRDAGKDLSTSIAQMASKNWPSYVKAFTFGSEVKTKEVKGKEQRYFVKKVSEGRFINPQELKALTEWAKELQKKQAEGKVHVDDSDLKDKSSHVEGDVIEGEVVSENSTNKSRF